MVIRLIDSVTIEYWKFMEIERLDTGMKNTIHTET